MEKYYVYILSSLTRVLYIGVTNDLVKRVWEHKNETVDGFTKTYKTKNLVYYEVTSSIEEALKREKQLKGWRRDKKISLIKTMNRSWVDLYKAIL